MKNIFYNYNKITEDTEWTWEQLMSAEKVKQPSFFDSANMILQEKKKRNVLVYTDYDTDGLTSGINLETILKHFFKEVIVTSNDKQYEGYNLTQKRIEKKLMEFKDQDAEVVIVTADVGVTDVAVMNWATSLSNVPYTITLDHHENHGELPKTTYLIDLKLDSNLSDVDNEYCTAGITWLWAMQIAKNSDKDSLKDTVLKLLPWTAVATIADMVPLNYGNFAIIEKGLSMVNNNEEYMYKKSMELFITKDDKYEQISYLQELLSRDVGFTISPLINASTRMTGKTQMAIDAITSENFLTFNQLKSLNEKRKLATKVSEISSKTIFNENGFAVSFIDKKFLQQKLDDYNNSHTKGLDINLDEAEDLLEYASGLAGIVASTLLKETKGSKASFTGTMSEKTLEDGTVLKTFHGSLRARPGVNLVKALDAVKEKYPNAVKGGGHAGAAGLSITSEANLVDVLRLMSVEIGKCEVESNVVYPASQFNVEEFIKLPLVFGMGRDIPAFKFTVNDLDIVSEGWDFKFKKSKSKGTMYFTPHVKFKGYEFAMNVYDSAYKDGFDFNNMCLVPGWGTTQHGKELVLRPMEKN